MKKTLVYVIIDLSFSLRTGRISALVYEDLSLTVTVLDSTGRKFANISSMDIGWSTSDESIATTAKENGVFYHSTTEFKQNLGYRPVSDARMVVKTTKALGNVDIIATLRKDSFMGFGTMKDSVSLSFVDDAIVVPG